MKNISLILVLFLGSFALHAQVPINIDGRRNDRPDRHPPVNKPVKSKKEIKKEKTKGNKAVASIVSEKYYLRKEDWALREV